MNQIIFSISAIQPSKRFCNVLDKEPSDIAPSKVYLTPSNELFTLENNSCSSVAATVVLY